MSNAVLFAVRRAIESARLDTGNTDVITLCELACMCIMALLFFSLLSVFFLSAAPATVEDIRMLCQTDVSHMVFQ